MNVQLVFILLIPGLFLAILACIELGRRMAVSRAAPESERERVALNTIEAAIYALLGLIVAFTFANASSRFDARRMLTIAEANAIGTAYLRVDVLPEPAQAPLRAKFRRYTLERIAVYDALPDMPAVAAHAARATALQGEIWRDSILALREARPGSTEVVLPALNDMIDITTTREVMLYTHTPALVSATLLVLTAVCALMIGNGLPRERSLATLGHSFGFALVLSVTLYVIFDFDYPRAGLIRLDFTDRAMTSLLASMPEETQPAP
jgi:hypothetical protein